MTASLADVFASQDQLITRDQALVYLTPSELHSRLGKRWRVALPGVYSSTTNALSYRQELRAGLLHAGPAAQIGDLSALRLYKVPFLPADPLVRVLVPGNVQRISTEFVVVRRTARLPEPVMVAGLPTVPLHRAVADFARRHPDEREALAVAAAAVQGHGVRVADLISEAQLGPARGRPRLLRVLEPLAAGVRSAPEQDFRMLVRRSRVLPEPLWNAVIVLSDGRIFIADALWLEAALIHEVNGKRYHAAEDAGERRFADMHRRAAGLTTEGFTVLGSAPSSIWKEGPAIIAELERCYLRDRGRGLPSGVKLARPGPTDTESNVALLGSFGHRQPKSA
jgi:hypothetical protein